MSLIHIIYFQFPPIFSWIKMLCNNHYRNRGCQFWHNRITTATTIFKNTTTEAVTATAVFWKLTTDPSLTISRLQRSLSICFSKFLLFFYFIFEIVDVQLGFLGATLQKRLRKTLHIMFLNLFVIQAVHNKYKNSGHII